MRKWCIVAAALCCASLVLADVKQSTSAKGPATPGTATVNVQPPTNTGPANGGTAASQERNFSVSQINPETEVFVDDAIETVRGTTCPVGTMFGMPIGNTTYNPMYSDVGANNQRATYFSGVTLPVQKVEWWGFDYYPADCVETTPTFNIMFYANNGGTPATTASITKSVTAQRTTSGMSWTTYGEAMHWKVTFTPAITLPWTEGFIAIQGSSSGTACRFLWANHDYQAASGHWVRTGTGAWTAQAYGDMSVCIIRELPVVYGACCENPTGTCLDNTLYADCLAGGDTWRFHQDQTCAVIVPECGKGACCDYTGAGTCSMNTDGRGYTQAQCTGPGKMWLNGLTCTSCCFFSPAGCAGTAEGEPQCADAYNDVYNNGCGSGSPIFHGDMESGQKVCGKSGTYLDGASVATRDNDWFKHDVPASGELITWTVKAEFPFEIALVRPTSAALPCELTWAADAEQGACNETVTISAQVAEGQIYMYVRPQAATQYLPCAAGAEYTAELTALSLATGACCVEGTCTVGPEVACPFPGIWTERAEGCTGFTCPTLTCPAGAYVEAEACGASSNSGCNTTPYAFEDVTCDTNLCGTAWSNDSTRDTDWYRIVINDPSGSVFFRYTLAAEFPVLGFILSYPGGECVGDATTNASGTAAAYDVLNLTATLANGTYYLWAGPDDWYEGFDSCTAMNDYVAYIGCGQPCDLTCPEGSTPEGEGDPCLGNSTNGGCSDDPIGPFTDIVCDENGVVICGTTGNWSDEEYSHRDLDWYRITLTEPKQIYAWLDAEFTTLFYLLQDSGGCNNTTLAGWESYEPCVSLSITETLSAGTYYLLVLPSQFSGTPCNAEYILQVFCGPPCDTFDCPEGSTPEGEPECHADYDDQYNLGCFGAEPREFQAIAVNQTICGKSGEYAFGADNYWESDWYTFTVAGTDPKMYEVQFTGQAEGGQFFVFTMPDGCDGDWMGWWDFDSTLPCLTYTIAPSTGFDPDTYYIMIRLPGECGANAPKYYLSLIGPAGCPGDYDCDGDRDFDDIKFLVAALGGEAAWAQYHVAHLGVAPTCDYLTSCDSDGNGAVDFDDIKPFVRLIGVTCP